MKTTALIMAGGRGERFWPRSRKTLPKQFLSLTDDGKTLIQLTVERILPLVAMEDIYVSTNQDYLPLVKEQLPNVPEQNILCEPVGRNTAPCIGLGAAHIAKKYGDALMVVLPSDHLVKYHRMFVSTVQDAITLAAEDDNLVTIGIAPDYPETGYGYIKFDPERAVGRGYEVAHFAEKPSIELAREYVSSDEYLWNSGMFIWKVSSILKRFEFIMPDSYEKLMVIKDAVGTGAQEEIVEKVFPLFPSISIDYGIMEKSNNIFTVPGNFGWDDVGSWNAVERTKKTNDRGNIADGNVICVNTTNCIIQAGEKLIAAVGLEDLVIVDTDDATLICDKGHTAEIKKVLEQLKTQGLEKYL